MKQDVLRLVPAFAFIVAVAAGLAFWRASPEQAPGFTLDIVAGQDVGDRIALSTLRGEVVVLEFWASWCTACRRSVPALNELHSRHPGAHFFGINSEGLSRQALTTAHDQFGFGFPTLGDDQGLAEAFAVEGLPTLVIIDREGRIQYHQTGMGSSPELDAEIDDLLGSLTQSDR